jgi:Cyclin, N-terminal domain
MRQETLFLAVYIIDKYLSMTRIAKDKLYLVGITGLFIASKYEEIYSPELSEFVKMLKNSSFCKKDIIRMEGAIILALNF